MASLMPSMDRANEAFIEAFGNPVAALRNFDLVRYFAVMAVTLVLYDRVLTFPVELKRIWSGHVSKTKILYVIHQELTLAALMFNTVVMTTQHSSDENFCRFWMSFQTWISIAIFTSIAIIFTRQLYELYNRDRHCLVMLVVLITTQVASTIALLVKRLSVTKVIDRPGPWFYGCFPDQSGSGLWHFWVPPMIFQSIATGVLFLRTVVLYQRSDANTKGTFFGCAQRNGLFEFMTMTLITSAGILVRVLGPASFIMLPLAPMTALASILGCRLLLKFLTMTAGSPTSFYDSAHSDGINHMDATHMANQAGARGGVQFTSHLTKDSAVSSVDFDLEKGKGRAQEQQLVTTPQVQTPPVVQPITSIAADLDQWRPPANQVSVTWADEKASEMRAEPIVPRSPGESTLECVEEESSMAEGSSQTEFNDNGDSGVDAIDTEGGRAVSVTSSKSSEAVDSGTVAAEIQVRNAGVEVLPSTPSGKDTEQIRQWLIEGPTFGSPITTVPEEDEDVDEDDGESWFEKYDDNGRPKRLFQRRWKSDDAPQPYFVHQPHLGPPSQPIASAPRRAFTIPSVPIKSKSKEPFLYHSPRHALGLGIERGAQLPFQALLAASNPTPTTKKFGDWSSPRSRARSVPKPEPSTSANNNMKPTFRNPTTQLSLFMQRRQREKPNDGHDHPTNGGSTNNANDVTNTQATSTTPPSATIRPPSPPIPLTSAHFPRSPTYTGAGLGNRNKPRSPPASSQTPRVRRLRQLLSNPSALANPPPHLEALPSPNGAPPAPSIRGSLRLGRVTSRSGESITSEYETATICSASTGWMFEVDASTAIQTEDLGAEGYGFGRQVTSPYS